MEPGVLGKISDGAMLQNAKPYIEPFITRRTQAAIAEAMRMIAKNTLTPDMALGLWMRVHATEQLRRDMDTHIRVGQTAGLSAGDAMNIGKGDTNGA